MKISSKNIAEAIYIASEGKSGNDLGVVLKKGVKIISDNRMIGQSHDILKALQEIIDKKSNVLRMRVTTAKILGHEEKNKLEHKIKEKYKAEKIISEYFEKKDLLGGMRIEVGDEIIDSTYKNKLVKLEKFLTRNN